MNTRYILLLFVIPIFFWGCSEKEIPKISEGIIEFEVTYPYFEGRPLTKSLLPDKMILRFKDDKLITKVSKSSMISTLILANGPEEKLSTGLDFGTEKIVTELNNEDLKYLRSLQPKLKIEYTDETDSIIGFHCKKAVAKYVDQNKPDIEIYYTEDISIKNGNFFTPYSEINGVLLVYDIEHYGVRMRISAKEFFEEEIDDSEFKINKNFKILSFQEYDARMNELFEKLMK